eukprot:IDg8765t1
MRESRVSRDARRRNCAYCVPQSPRILHPHSRSGRWRTFSSASSAAVHNAALHGRAPQRAAAYGGRHRLGRCLGVAVKMGITAVLGSVVKETADMIGKCWQREPDFDISQHCIILCSFRPHFDKASSSSSSATAAVVLYTSLSIYQSCFYTPRSCGIPPRTDLSSQLTALQPRLKGRAAQYGVYRYGRLQGRAEEREYVNWIVYRELETGTAV